MQTKERRLTFRPAKTSEELTLKSFLEGVTTCGYNKILERRLLYGLYGGPFIELFAITKSMLSIIGLLKSGRLEPYAAGVPLGIVKKDAFKPSLPLARTIVRRCDKRSINIVVLDERAEKKFLYGKDVYVGTKKVKQFNTTKGRSYVLVVNSMFDVLGWGFIREKVGGKVKLQNIVDVGWYLRSGG